MKLALLGGEAVRASPFTMESPQISEGDIAAVLECLTERRLSIFSSPKIRQFEEAFAAYVGTKHAVAVTSGTAALQSAICAAQIQPGDEIIVPVYTYAATINAILLQGAVPVFVDVKAETFVIDGVDVAEIASAISARTRAILVVDLFGNAPPRSAVQQLALKHGLRLIEDCAQSTGSVVHGRPVGSFDIGCHSFGEIKNMTSAEGGMLTTDDGEVARRARLLRHSGEVWRSTRDSTIGASPGTLIEMIRGIDYEFVGTNFRMNALQAALGASQLRRLDDFNAERIRVAARYCAEIGGSALLPMQVHEDVSAVYNRFPILLGDQLGLSRDAFLAALIAEGVPAGVYYPMPFNSTSVIRKRSGLSGSAFPFALGRDLSENYAKRYPGAERACERHVLLPCYPGLTEQDACDVIAACKKVLEATSDAGIAAEVEVAAKSAAATYFGQFFSAGVPC